MTEEHPAEPSWWLGLSSAARMAGDAGGRSLSPDDERHGALRLRSLREGRVIPGRAAVSWPTADVDLVALLGERSESLARRIPEPAWLRIILDAYADSGEAGRVASCLCAGEQQAAPAEPVDRVFLGWIDPLLAWARAELRAALGSAGTVPLEHPVLQPDEAVLLMMIKRVLVQELGIARLRQQLCGSTDEETFRCFGRGIRRRPVGRRLLSHYPVLGAQLVDHLRTWVTTRLEFVERLAVDAPLLAERFDMPGLGLASITGLRFDAGDAHRGGRSVVFATFESGSLVYKPRSMAVDCAFRDLLDWLNRQGHTPPLVTPVVVDRGTHGWASEVVPRECASAPELRRFYRRQGSHLAIFYLLRAYDMHMYNVIAAGEHPVYVDLEAMFHSPADFELADQHSPLVGRELRESVLACMVLPQPRVDVTGDGVHASDVSALNGDPGSLQRRYGIGYEAEGTSRMSVVRKAHSVSEAHHLPDPRNRQSGGVDVTAEVVAGFSSCYRTLAAARADLAAGDGPLAAFAGAAVRAVLRDTRVYKEMLAESWHPDLLGDALHREYFLGLPAGTGDAGADAKILISEQRQLLQRDIPIFGSTTDGTALEDHDGPLVRAFWADSGMSAVLNRLNVLSEDDLARQTWYIEAAMSIAEPQDHVPGQRVVKARRGAHASPALSSELAIAAAGNVAERLVSTIVEGTARDGPEWVTLNEVGNGHRVIGATPLGISSGVAGIALFLAELDSLVGDLRYREIVENLVASLVEVDEPPTVQDLEGMSAGFYADLGSVLYLLTRLEQLWRRPLTAPALPWLLPALEHNVMSMPDDATLSGAAGAALAVLRLHQMRPDPATLRLLQRLGTLALPQARAAQPGPGALSGSSGVAYAWGAVGAEIADPDLSALAIPLLGDGTWGEPDPAPPLGWCGGEAGGIVARAGLLRVISDTGDRTLLRNGILSALASGESRLRPESAELADDSLCHGRLGVAAALCTAADALGRDSYRRRGSRLAAEVAQSVLAGRALSGAPKGVWVPDLLTGAAGIGYGLLQIAMPGTVPDILLAGAPSPADADTRPIISATRMSSTC